MPSSSEPRAPSAADRLKVLTVSFLGLGLAPVASGTFGTLGGVVVAVPLAWAPGLPYWAWLLLATLVVTLVCVALGPWAERYYGLKDPGAIVLDEVGGYMVTLALFDVVCGGGAALGFEGHLAAFLAFRVGDIVKPWPARAFERLPGGWGVMLDDLVAGLYAGAILVILERTGVPWL
ncbi:MAG: phosphatidylglycerophosphatase A [Planctomycetota bacterium]